MNKKNILKSVLLTVKTALSDSIKDIYNINDNLSILPFTKSNEYDYQTAFPVKLFNMNKKNENFLNENKSFMDIGNKVKNHAIENYKTMFKNIEVNNKGFFLIKVADKFIIENINVITSNDDFVVENLVKNKVAVDFSSPNIAKEMHVGHLRSTIMGESICRILEFLGDEVFRINHLGDWGTQFGMLIQYLFEEYPDHEVSMPKLKELEDFYRASKNKFDKDLEFKNRAKQAVVKLQSGDEKHLKAWKVICDISREFFKKIYNRLEIKNNEYGESFYNDKIPNVIKELEEKKLIKEDDGAKCIFIPKKKVPLIAIKKDGGYNYDSTDLAAIHYRLNVLGCDRLLYITDVGQYPHFELIFEAAKMADWYNPKEKRVEHMGFGVILGTNGERMKTRSGDTVKLNDLLDSAKDKAYEQLIKRKEENKEVKINDEDLEKDSEILGINSLKYFDLRLNRTQNYKFDLDNMLNIKGNTAIYLMYSYIRICSIFRKAEEQGINLEKLKEIQFKITHDEEIKLGSHLMKFSEIVLEVSNNLTINRLCDYLYDLSVLYSKSYKNYKILNNENSETRLLMMLAIKKVYEKCFYLLGLKPIDKI